MGIGLPGCGSVDFGASGLPCFVNVSWLSISWLEESCYEHLPLKLLQVNYTTGFAPRAKARSNFAALQAINERLSHRERQEKDIFHVTGQGYKALNDYEKWHSFPARFAGFACATDGVKPTGNTHFKKGGTLYTYFEIYEPLIEGQSPAGVQIKIRIIDLKAGEATSDSQPISAAPYVKAGSSIIPVGRGMDISKLPIGSYWLDVQATDSTGKSTPWRSANFTVVRVGGGS